MITLAELEQLRATVARLVDAECGLEAALWNNDAFPDLRLRRLARDAARAEFHDLTTVLAADSMQQVIREQIVAAELRAELLVSVGASVDLVRENEQGIPDRTVSDVPEHRFRVRGVPSSVDDAVLDLDNPSLQPGVDFLEPGSSAAHQSSPVVSSQVLVTPDVSEHTVGDSGDPVGTRLPSPSMSPPIAGGTPIPPAIHPTST